MHPKDAAEIANRVDPDQTAPALFAQFYLSENLGTLRYAAMVVWLEESWQINEKPRSTITWARVRILYKFLLNPKPL